MWGCSRRKRGHADKHREGRTAGGSLESQVGKLGWHQEGQIPPHSDLAPSRGLHGAISCRLQLPRLHGVDWEEGESPQRTHRGQGGRQRKGRGLSQPQSEPRGTTRDLPKLVKPSSTHPFPWRLTLPGEGSGRGCLEWKRWPVNSIPWALESRSMGIATMGSDLPRTAQGGYQELRTLPRP